MFPPSIIITLLLFLSILTVEIVVSLSLICSFTRMKNHLGLDAALKPEDIPEEIVLAVADVLRSSTSLRISEDGKFLLIFIVVGLVVEESLCLPVLSLYNLFTVSAAVAFLAVLEKLFIEYAILRVFSLPYGYTILYPTLPISILFLVLLNNI